MTIKIDEITRDRDLSMTFLKECFIYFRQLRIEQEILEDRKMVTGSGVSREDWKSFSLHSWCLLAKKTEFYDTIYKHWIESGRIFKYKRQLIGLIRKYEYKMASQGV